jgi:3-(3-hydroxy-phenyl)propionate hydroxylase
VIDVAIVGYGPVGATAANLLGARGLEVEVFEATTSVYHLPRAAHFDAEVMRVFQGIGLANAVLSCAAPVRGMHFVTASGQKLMCFDAPDEPTANGWAAGYMFYQPDLERTLRAGVTRFPNVRVNLGTEVTAVRDGEVEAAGRVVRARYVLGCDGARSLVRRSAGIELDDAGFDQPWLVVDTFLRRDVALSPVVLQVCDPSRPSTFVPSAGAHRRWEFMVMPGERPEEMEKPARVRELLAPWVDPDAVDVVRAVVYSFHALVSSSWRTGSLVLAGDAAHQMPPFLGQGMCAGIRDVASLAWKLDLVLRGTASDALLDTYQTEREPDVRQIVRLAVQLGGLIQTTDAAVAAARDAQFAEQGPASLGGELMPASGPGVFHRSSSRKPFPQVGVRDEQLGDGFAIVASEPVAFEAPIERCVVDDGSVGATIVRPDRYVFGVAGSSDALRTMMDDLRRLVGAGARG